MEAIQSFLLIDERTYWVVSMQNLVLTVLWFSIEKMMIGRQEPDAFKTTNILL